MSTIVVTGASSGIGLVVAREMARAGWRVIMHGRDAARTAAALAQVRAAAPGASVETLLADMSTVNEVVRLADAIAALTDRIDVLANNAGFIPAARVVTTDGLEQCFAANHLAPFVLTNRLLPLLRAAGPGAQVINTASVAHRFIKDMLWDDLQQERSFSPSHAYAQSKLANILHARALAERVRGDGIRVNAMHPGLVATNFPAHGNRLTRMVYRFTKPFQLTPAQGADTIVWLAQGGAPEATGGYFVKRKITATTPAAQSWESGERLWGISEALAARALS